MGEAGVWSMCAGTGAVIATLLKAARVVHGVWGTARAVYWDEIARSKSQYLRTKYSAEIEKARHKKGYSIRHCSVE